MAISRDDMALYIRDGGAQPWTMVLGGRRIVFDAALLNGIWYAAMDDTPDYQEVPAPFAALLNTLQSGVDIVVVPPNDVARHRGKLDVRAVAGHPGTASLDMTARREEEGRACGERGRLTRRS